MAGGGGLEVHDLRLAGKFRPDLFDFRPAVEREAGGQVFGHRHPGHDADVEEPFAVERLAEFLVASRPLHPETIRCFAPRPSGGSEIEGRVRLAPSAAGFRAARAGRVDEDLRPAAAAASGRVFELRPREDGHQQEGRGAGGPHEVEERPVAGDELVSQETALEDLGGVLAHRPDRRDADGQVADLNGELARRLEVDRPVEDTAVGFEPFDDFEGRRRSAARVSDGACLGRGLPFRPPGRDLRPVPGYPRIDSGG